MLSATDIGELRRSMGLRVSAARRRAGLTPAALAERAGLQGALLIRIEQGDASPSIDMLFHLAAALSVHPCELLQEHDREASLRERLEYLLDRMEADRLELLSRLAELAARAGVAPPSGGRAPRTAPVHRRR